MCECVCVCVCMYVLCFFNACLNSEVNQQMQTELGAWSLHREIRG